MIQAAIHRLLRGLRTWPSGRDWVWSALVATVALAAMGVVGLIGGLYTFTGPRPLGWPLGLAIVFVAPALGEELVFRGLLVPDRSETTRPWLAIATATALFTGWHVVEATTFLPRAAPIFLRGDFLGCAAILGLACALVRWRTSSIWPAVLLHWVAVAIWQGWLGGPGLEALR